MVGPDNHLNINTNEVNINKANDEGTTTKKIEGSSQQQLLIMTSEVSNLA